MKVNIILNKKYKHILIYLDKILFLKIDRNKNLSNKFLKLLNNDNNLSLNCYHYLIILKILREFGLIKGLINKKEF